MAILIQVQYIISKQDIHNISQIPINIIPDLELSAHLIHLISSFRIFLHLYFYPFYFSDLLYVLTFSRASKGYCQPQHPNSSTTALWLGSQPLRLGLWILRLASTDLSVLMTVQLVGCAAKSPSGLLHPPGQSRAGAPNPQAGTISLVQRG